MVEWPVRPKLTIPLNKKLHKVNIDRIPSHTFINIPPSKQTNYKLRLINLRVFFFFFQNCLADFMFLR